MSFITSNYNIILGAVVVKIVCFFIYNYLCNQCLSPLNLWFWTPFMVRCTRCNSMWQSLSVNCNRSVVFSWYPGFLNQWNWPPRYSWNIVGSGVKHHNPNPFNVRWHLLCQIIVLLYNELHKGCKFVYCYFQLKLECLLPSMKMGKNINIDAMYVMWK